MPTGMLVLPVDTRELGLKQVLDPFVASNEIMSNVYNDPAIAGQRAYLRERFGEIGMCFCSDRLLDSELCTEDAIPGLFKVYRGIGAKFRAGDQPMQSRIESLLRHSDAKGRPATTLFVFAHTICAGHGGNDVEALAAAERFVIELIEDYQDYRNPDGTRRLFPVKAQIDKITGSWTIFSGGKSLCAQQFTIYSAADRSVRIRLALESLFSDRNDIHEASLAAIAYLFEENVKYLNSHVGCGPLTEAELRPGIIIAVGKGLPWVKRMDNVFVVEDHHPDYVHDLATPIERVEGRVGAIVSSATYSEIITEPYRKRNAIRRSLKIQERIKDFIHRVYPDLHGVVPVISTVFSWDSWLMKFHPEIAERFGYHSWTA